MSGVEVRRVAGTDELAAAAAEEVTARLVAAVAARGRASLVLAGGATPRPLYRLLAEPDRQGRLPWASVEVFFGDERAVRPDETGSNFAAAHEDLLALLDPPPAAVHRMRGELPPVRAAADYESELTAALGRPPRFDLVLLGLGADGHTASLFPGDEAGEECVLPGQLVAAATAPAPPRRRVTLTYEALAGAAEIVFLVAGAGKAAAVAAALSGDAALPAARVRSREGRVVWLLDAAAAGGLGAGVPAPGEGA